MFGGDIIIRGRLFRRPLSINKFIAKDRCSHTKESFEQILKIFMNDNGKINAWLEDKPLFRTIAYQNIPHLKGLKPSYADFF